MKKIFAVAVLVMFAQVAQADYLLRFADGTAVVWDSYYAKDSRYCTEKPIGTVCWAKADVKKIVRVAPGTEVSDYGISTLEANTEVEQRRQDASKINADVVSEMERNKSRRDREIDVRAQQEQDRVKKNRKDGKADWAR